MNKQFKKKKRIRSKKRKQGKEEIDKDAGKENEIGGDEKENGETI